MKLQNIVNSIDKKQIITGIIVAFIISTLAASKSFIFSPTDITGEWTVYVTTDTTSYKAYKNLTSIFKFTITQHPNGTIIGNGEKIRDINPDGSETNYATVQRDQVKYNGIIKQAYFGKATASIDIDCKGSRYKSTAHYALTVVSKNNITGHFTTTISNGRGHIVMKKDE